MNRRRTCARCHTPLTGRRGHGFVIQNGAAVLCSGCNAPGNPKRPKVIPLGDGEVGYGRR